MKRNKKTLLKRNIPAILLTFALLAGMVTGCGNTAGTSSETTAVSSAETTINTSGETTVAVSAETTVATSTPSPESTQPSSGTHTVVDLAGREVTIPNNVTKVAALCGPSYETVIMLGTADQVVMTGNSGGTNGWATKVCPEYADIPVCEDSTSPNIEELLNLGVEVVLYWDSYPEVEQALSDAGISMVVTQLDDNGISTAEEFVELKKKEITLVGDVFGGDAVDKAAKWCSYVDEVTSFVTSRTSTLEELPSVYYVRGPESLKIHGGNSYTRYLVDMAGGDLVSKNDKELLYTTTMEQAIEWDPQYIFMGRVDNVELITEDPAWSAVRAVKDGNVYVNLKCVGPSDYSTDCFLLMEQVATILHPDLFKDLDMTDAVQKYFKDFYNYDLTADEAALVLVSKGPAS